MLEVVPDDVAHPGSGLVLAGRGVPDDAHAVGHRGLVEEPCPELLLPVLEGLLGGGGGAALHLLEQGLVLLVDLVPAQALLEHPGHRPVLALAAHLASHPVQLGVVGKERDQPLELAVLELQGQIRVGVEELQHALPVAPQDPDPLRRGLRDGLVAGVLGVARLARHGPLLGLAVVLVAEELARVLVLGVVFQDQLVGPVALQERLDLLAGVRDLLQVAHQETLQLA